MLEIARTYNIIILTIFEFKTKTTIEKNYDTILTKAIAISANAFSSRYQIRFRREKSKDTTAGKYLLRALVPYIALPFVRIYQLDEPARDTLPGKVPARNCRSPKLSAKFRVQSQLIYRAHYCQERGRATATATPPPPLQRRVLQDGINCSN